MQAKTENRNQFVDIMRGIAMLLVVLQHTMSGCTVGAENTFVFNIAWSLQMPLFILISGYVTKYSRPISDGKGLWKYVKRRTVAYMLPWAVWSFLVRGMSDGGFAIILRAATSLAGCIAVCGLCRGIFSSKIGGVLLHGSESTCWKCISRTICYSA